MNETENGKEYLRYWDDVIRQWAGTGLVPDSERCWFDAGLPLHASLMPEPYWGDPDNCSVVLLNYNPGGPDGAPSPDDNCHIDNVRNGETTRMSGAMASCYSALATSFPWLDTGKRNDFTTFPTHDATRRWMRRRADWVARIAGNDRRPFLLDLCGWHSKNWRLREYTPGIMEYVKTHVMPVLRSSILGSDLGVGLCVGKQFSDVVLPQMGFADFTSELGFPVGKLSEGWQPDSETSRWYRVYRSGDGVYVVNTWSVGSNGSPDARFREYELQIINKIKSKE